MNRHQHSPPRILLLGDSITEGFCLSEYLPDVTATNHGISGLSSAELLKALRIDWFVPMPDWVFLCIGTNDIARNISFASMLANTTQLVHQIRLHAPEARIFLTSLFPTLHNTPRPNTLIRQYNQLLHSLAIDLNTDYWHLFPLFADRMGELKKAFTNDGLHLTGEAYRNWANLLRNLWLSS